MGQSKRFETVVNIAMLAASALTIGFVADQYSGQRLSSGLKNRWEDRALLAGRDPEIRRLTNGRPALILALSTKCGACQRELPRYRRLLEEVERQGIPVQIVGVFPQPETEAREYLAGHDLAGMPAVTSGLLIERVRFTPTLLVVGREGKVKDIWRGAGAQSLDGMLAALGELGRS